MAATNQMMLVALYNAANTELPHQVTDKEVTFGQPVALEKGDKNTKVIKAQSNCITIVWNLALSDALR